MILNISTKSNVRHPPEVEGGRQVKAELVAVGKGEQSLRDRAEQQLLLDAAGSLQRCSHSESFGRTPTFLPVRNEVLILPMPRRLISPRGSSSYWLASTSLVRGETCRWNKNRQRR